MDVTIVVGTFGSPEWVALARKRALPSADKQGCPVIHVHDHTLAEARNRGIALATTTWVCVLDADDEMSDGYIPGLLQGSADIRAPRLVEVHEDGTHTHVELAHRDIEKLNPLPVSCLARRDLILAAGGFQPWQAWEDYALWLRMVRAGATYEHSSAATLFAHVRAGSRNRTVTGGRRLLAEIQACA